MRNDFLFTYTSIPPIFRTRKGQSMTKYINGLHEIVDSYDGFVIDLMGVVHDGTSLFPGTLECLNKLKQLGKTVVFLSNAPRRSSVAAAKLDKFKLNNDLYHKVITSGEHVHHSLKHRNDPWYKELGQKAYHIGTNKDTSLFEEESCEKTENIDEADFVLNSDIKAWNDTPAQYEEILQQARQRSLPMVCANPDLIVQIKGSLQYCAGALAKRYEELGGDVSYHGKPYPSVYGWVRELFPDNARLLAIGDAFETDIKGANNAGIDSAFIGCGIHFKDLNAEYGQLPEAKALEQMAKDHGVRPTYVLPGLIY